MISSKELTHEGIKMISTKDGSNSLYLPQINEHYHSIHGAISESLHVFIENGLKSMKNNPISILEVGFGTGLNAWLTAIHAEKLSRKVKYTGFELYPLSPKDIKKLNYPSQYGSHEPLWNAIHSSDWSENQALSENFELFKKQGDIHDLKDDLLYNLCYFDAFAPEKQPEMWSEELFSKILMSLKPDGELITYCAKGDVRRTLKKVGFTVERLAGPPGKREMLRGIKK
jgi:tRNA U34 5-methylaminomethyl-2-thiouridine-forming methyltransferase MnmC